MSSYRKKTNYKTPSSQNSQIIAWSVPKERVIAKDFKIVNFGLKSYSGGAPAYYPAFCGVTCLIDTITVYDGAQQVAQLRQVPQKVAEIMLSNPADWNYSLYSTQYQTGLAYDLSNDVPPSSAPVYFQTIGLGGDILALGTGAAQSCIELGSLLPYFYGLDSESYDRYTRARNRRDMRELRRIVRRSTGIPIGHMDLRIEIQLSQLDNTLLFVGGQSGADKQYEIPQLVYDSYEAPDMPEFAIVYDNYDYEGFSTAAKSVGDRETIDRPLNSSIGNYCKEITMINAPQVQDISNTRTLSYCSVGLKDEMDNLIINDLLVVPKNVCNTPARKQMYLNYTRPLFTTPVGGSVYSHMLSTTPNGLFGPTATAANPAALLQRCFSYVTFGVGAVIGNARVLKEYTSYSDNARTLTAQTGQLAHHFFFNNRYIHRKLGGSTTIASI